MNLIQPGRIEDLDIDVCDPVLAFTKSHLGCDASQDYRIKP